MSRFTNTPARDTTRYVLLRRVADVDAALSRAMLIEGNEARALPLLETRVALLRALADLGDRAYEAPWNHSFDTSSNSFRGEPSRPGKARLRPAAYTGD